MLSRQYHNLPRPRICLYRCGGGCILYCCAKPNAALVSNIFHPTCLRKRQLLSAILIAADVWNRSRNAILLPRESKPTLYTFQRHAETWISACVTGATRTYFTCAAERVGAKCTLDTRRRRQLTLTSKDRFYGARPTANLRHAEPAKYSPRKALLPAASSNRLRLVHACLCSSKWPIDVSIIPEMIRCM